MTQLNESAKRTTLERNFNASIDDVWELWTTKDGIESWWGPDGFAVKTIMDLLINLKTTPASVLIERVQQIDWRSVSYDSRLVVLHQVNESITNFRVSVGLSPIDDPLPGQAENAFRLIKATLFS